MENQPTILDKAVKLGLIVGALLVALSVAYYLVIFLPQKERIAQDRQDQQRSQNKVFLANCLDGAAKLHEQNWNEACASRGDGDRCGLPSNTSSRIDKSYESSKDDCFKKFPQ